MTAPGVPSDEMCLRYASGALDPALSLLVDAHLARHPATQARIEAFRELGGAALAAEAPAPMTAGALDVVFARIAREDAAPPAAFNLADLQWRWAGFGCRVARYDVPGSRLKTFAIKVAPGAALLSHGHEGNEWTVIVEGAYRDESGVFPAGSFIEEDDETQHRPVADETQGCVCLIAMTGDLVAPGLVGALARWALR